MNKETVREAIVKKIEEMQNKKCGIATNYDYQLGVVSGMLRAFVIAGVITEDEGTELRDKIFEEDI